MPPSLPYINGGYDSSMARQLSNCIALGVGTGRVEEAATFYEKNFGGTRGKTGKDWIEIKSGPLRLFLVGDENGTPTFDLTVENVDQAVADLVAAGCEVVDLGGAPDEKFVKDPYGHFFCVSLAESC